MHRRMDGGMDGWFATDACALRWTKRGRTYPYSLTPFALMPSRPLECWYQVWSYEELENLAKYHRRKAQEYELAVTDASSNMCYHERKLAAAKSLAKYHERKCAEARGETQKLYHHVKHSHAIYQQLHHQVRRRAEKCHKKYHGKMLAEAMRMVAKLQKRS